MCGAIGIRSHGETYVAILGCMADVTQILNQIERGDPAATEQLLPLVYEELRRLAAAKLVQEKPGQTLQATALVHEAYLRLVDVKRVQRWDSRGHFFAAAAEAMRRLLVEQYRRKQRIKNGGELQRVPLPDIVADRPEDDLEAMDEALTELAAEDELAAKVVVLRYFAGLGHEQIAEFTGVTVYEARKKWTYARAWLREKLSDS